MGDRAAQAIRDGLAGKITGSMTRLRERWEEDEAQRGGQDTGLRARKSAKGKQGKFKSARLVYNTVSDDSDSDPSGSDANRRLRRRDPVMRGAME